MSVCDTLQSTLRRTVQNRNREDVLLACIMMPYFRCVVRTILFIDAHSTFARESDETPLRDYAALYEFWKSDSIINELQNDLLVFLNYCCSQSVPEFAEQMMTEVLQNRLNTDIPSKLSTDAQNTVQTYYDTISQGSNTMKTMVDLIICEISAPSTDESKEQSATNADVNHLCDCQKCVDIRHVVEQYKDMVPTEKVQLFMYENFVIAASDVDGEELYDDDDDVIQQETDEV